MWLVAGSKESAAVGLAVVGFEPVERGVHLRVQPEVGAALNEVGPLLRRSAGPDAIEDQD